MLQVHTAVSRVVEYLELTSGEQFPSADTVLHGYLHFEALTEHDYQYSCVSCGDHPPVVIMDLHRKGAFHLSVSDLPQPPVDFNGEVDMECFWDALSMERIGRGFVTSQQKNPFAVPPTFHFWAPWIGKNTRRSNHVLNTEFAKVRPQKPAEVQEITVTEDRLREELYRQKVEVVRTLCRECGLDSSGSRPDLLLRLSNEMKSRQTYDKVFQKIWAASGGWAVIMCPCGIVYSIKCNIRAESPRDFTDILLSWKHMPNIVIYDFARGLATHMNLREPEKLPFTPFEGRLMAPTPDNIKQAKDGKLKVSLPWLNCKKLVPDPECHPITGSAEHYALYDRFHEDNTKDARDALRRLGLVPQLAGQINSQVAEQLFARMKKNNYFLNMALPTTHLFLMRNIIHHYNVHKNKQ
ncbi:HMG domain containing protein 3 [Dissostichus eleginoides]|uniref:HMG domain containing protein 3 n=2 Tax=Dissostichus eleginoides TaxID=100907 RepID=A0AAD9EXT1_DISEL|nr:HMG domain containing protein 3 [Dissostichus eleginoides]